MSGVSSPGTSSLGTRSPGTRSPGTQSPGTQSSRRQKRPLRIVGQLLACVWIIYLADPWTDAWDLAPGLSRVVGLVGVSGVALTYVVAMVARMRTTLSRTASVVLVGLELAFVATAAWGVGEVGLVGLVFVSVTSIFLFRPRTALLVAAGCLVVSLVLPRLVPGWSTIDSLAASVVLSSVAVFGVSQLIQRNRELRAAQEEVAALAVTRERDRIARDMHDILGHSLTVISVKAELAARLLDADPGRARDEIGDVQTLARSALADVRSMVTGTRVTTLSRELAGARAVLDSAGVQAAVPSAVDIVPEHLREVFAWAVREGTTNVLRHAAAHRVQITLAADRVVVEDDGRGVEGALSGDATSNGLDGLRERAQAAGATVETGPSPLGGFRLAVHAVPGRTA